MRIGKPRFKLRLHPNDDVIHVLKSGLFSSNTQLDVIEFVHWGVKQWNGPLGINF